MAFHAEGPVWFERWGGLRWVDMFAGDILSLHGDTVSRRRVGTIAVALRPRSVGGAVIALERGFALEDAGGTITERGALWDDPGLRMNEGGCDPGPAESHRLERPGMEPGRLPGLLQRHPYRPDRCSWPRSVWPAARCGSSPADARQTVKPGARAAARGTESARRDASQGR